MGVGHNCSMFTLSAFDVVDGYSHTSGDEDLIIDRRLKAHPDVKQANPSGLRIDEWFYIYRWGSVPCISQVGLILPVGSHIRDGTNELVRCT
jgi:hypothetical protein